MSWIIRELWQSLDDHRVDYESLLRQGKFEGYSSVNRIAGAVAAKWGIVIQVNFPPGRQVEPATVGRRDLSILVQKERKKFENVTEEELMEAFRKLDPVSIEKTGFGHEGYKIMSPTGRIDCLPGAVHIWCEITPKVSQFLDWLFTKVYGLKPMKE